MKILLVAVNAKYIHSNLAVYSLKAYAEKAAGIPKPGVGRQPFAGKIEIAEYTINQYADDILRQLYEKQPDLIAFSCYIWNIETVTRLIREFHKLKPNVPVWVGGPEVSYRAKELLAEFPQITGVMMGEGEQIFANLVRAYSESERQEWDRADLRTVRGIVYRNGTDILETPPEAELNMDQLPFIYQDMEQFENRIVYYESSRGCPFSCSYCLSSVEKRMRFRSLELVKRELQFFLDHRVPQVKLVDRTFNCDKNRALELWRYLLEHDNGVTNFHFEIAADLITEEQIAVIRRMRPGLIQLEIGVQSTNPPTIAEIRRITDLGKIKTVVSEIHAGRNVHQHLDLIAGLPYEDLRQFRQSFNEVYAMEPDQLQLGFLKILSGSYMEEQKERYGLVCREEPPYEVLYTKWMSYDDLCVLKRVEAVLEIYYNSGQFRNTMKCLIREFETPYDCYEALGNFYEAAKPNGEKHSRLTRYLLLLAFIKQIGKGMEEERAAIYRELLTLDVYLRENSKTRPEFAADLSPYKQATYAFYRQEAQTREALPDYKAYNDKQLIKMTHLEYFSYDLPAFIEEGRITKEPMRMLFDYQNRSPLNQEARTKLYRGFGMEEL